MEFLKDQVQGCPEAFACKGDKQREKSQMKEVIIIRSKMKIMSLKVNYKHQVREMCIT
jgi:hypothetical protein